ncbi:hypothetical protein MRB53_034530 [Persea americana]|uniref:Uncharacterized protein n=1 Tax=Persea americana TaxID=3435 RepID=A0ACC2K220_PERAE|nr:hypothetical protein MRB53_034530 [Persea americana]
MGRKFFIQTDQRSLKYLLEYRITTPEQQRWVSKLFGYEYEIIYKPGKENSAADALSRMAGSTCLDALFVSQAKAREEGACLRLVSFVATEKTNGRQLVHVCSVDIRPLCLSPSITGFCATGTGDASPAQGLRHRCKRGRLLPVTEPVKKITGLPSISCSCTGNCRRKRRRNGVASNDHCRNQIAVEARRGQQRRRGRRVRENLPSRLNQSIALKQRIRKKGQRRNNQLLAIDGTRASAEPTAFCSNLNQ